MGIYRRHKDLYRPRTLAIIEEGKQVTDTELADLRGNVLFLRELLETQMAQAGMDLWVCPAAIGPAPEGLHATGDPNMNLPWTHAGLPALTLPGARLGRLPLGIQLVAQTDDDELLLAWSADIAAILKS